MPIQTTRAFFTVPSTCNQTSLAQPSRNPHLLAPHISLFLVDYGENGVQGAAMTLYPRKKA